MSRRDKIKEEVQKKDDEIYGDETISGSNPAPQSDDDVEEIVEDALGDDAAANVNDPQDDGFNIAEEIEEDEEGILEGPIVDTPSNNSQSSTSSDDDDADEDL